MISVYSALLRRVKIIRRRQSLSATARRAVPDSFLSRFDYGSCGLQSVHNVVTSLVVTTTSHVSQRLYDVCICYELPRRRLLSPLTYRCLRSSSLHGPRPRITVQKYTFDVTPLLQNLFLTLSGYISEDIGKQKNDIGKLERIARLSEA